MQREINLIDPTAVQIGLPGMLDKIQAAEEQKRVEKQARVHIKRIIEALLFATHDPLSFKKIREVIDHFHPTRPRIVREMIVDIQDEYISQGRAFRLEEIAQGFILRSCEEYGKYIEQLYRNKRTEKLSHASSEVLAIIAYKQPITKPQIEAIRGVDSSGIVQNLLERQLIQAVGRQESPGRPTLFGITPDFLKHYGLNDIKDLNIISDQQTATAEEPAAETPAPAKPQEE